MSFVNWAQARTQCAYAVSWLPRWLQVGVLLMAILWLAKLLHIGAWVWTHAWPSGD